MERNEPYREKLVRPGSRAEEEERDALALEQVEFSEKIEAFHVVTGKECRFDRPRTGRSSRKTSASSWATPSHGTDQIRNLNGQTEHRELAQPTEHLAVR